MLARLVLLAGLLLLTRLLAAALLLLTGLLPALLLLLAAGLVLILLAHRTLHVLRTSQDQRSGAFRRSTGTGASCGIKFLLLCRVAAFPPSC